MKNINIAFEDEQIDFLEKDKEVVGCKSWREYFLEKAGYSEGVSENV